MHDSSLMLLFLLPLAAILLLGLCLGLQIWLASRPRLLPGLVQPTLWALLVLAGNLLARFNGAAVQSGFAGAGALLMAVLSLAVFLAARKRLNEKYKK